MNGCIIFRKVSMRFGFLVLTGLFFAQIALANTFTVNTHTPYADANLGDCHCAGPAVTGGLCGLTTAIAEAEACKGPDTIEIPGGTYNSGNISISTAILFKGLGILKIPTILQFTGTSTIIVEQTVAADARGWFENLTLKGGKYIGNSDILGLDQVTVSGFSSDTSPVIGGIGSLTITSSRITGNSTSTIYGLITTSGRFSITDSEIYANSAPSGCGGAIYYSSTLGLARISDTRIHDNISEKGGAICAKSGDVVITRSSLTNNKASLEGGAIYTGSNSGGGHVYLINTTVSGNQADGNGGAIMVENGRVSLASSTVTNNTANADDVDGGSGGGVYKVDGLHGSVYLKNTVLAQNTYRSGIFEPHSDCSGEIRSDGFNFIGFRGFGCTILSGTGDQVGHHAAIDPLLNPLQLIGGTNVHTLQAGSPAIDAGNIDGCRDYDDTVLTTDQPGEDRSKGFACDNGASESGYFAGRVLATPVSGSETTEAGGSARLSFKLNGTPTGSVTVPLLSSNTAEGTIAASIVFPSGLNQEQIIWVYGVDDDIEDGDVGYEVITGAVSSTDARFDGFDPDDVSVTNLDDDGAVFVEDIFLDSFE